MWVPLLFSTTNLVDLGYGLGRWNYLSLELHDGFDFAYDNDQWIPYMTICWHSGDSTRQS